MELLRQKFYGMIVFRSIDANQKFYDFFDDRKINFIFNARVIFNDSCPHYMLNKHANIETDGKC